MSAPETQVCWTLRLATASRRSQLAMGGAVLVAFLVACGAGSATSPVASAPAAESSDADAGEPSCDELARSRVVCATALTQRCQSQMNDCEAACEARGGLPGNPTRGRLPPNRADFEVARCRNDCRIGFDACLRLLVAQCPRRCE